MPDALHQYNSVTHWNIIMMTNALQTQMQHWQQILQTCLRACGLLLHLAQLLNSVVQPGQIRQGEQRLYVCKTGMQASSCPCCYCGSCIHLQAAKHKLSWHFYAAPLYNNLVQLPGKDLSMYDQKQIESADIPRLLEWWKRHKDEGLPVTAFNTDGYLKGGFDVSTSWQFGRCPTVRNSHSSLPWVLHAIWWCQGWLVCQAVCTSGCTLLRCMHNQV